MVCLLGRWPRLALGYGPHAEGVARVHTRAFSKRMCHKPVRGPRSTCSTNGLDQCEWRILTYKMGGSEARLLGASGKQQTKSYRRLFRDCPF